MAPPRKRKKQPTITEHGDLDGRVGHQAPGLDFGKRRRERQLASQQRGAELAQVRRPPRRFARIFRSIGRLEGVPARELEAEGEVLRFGPS